MNCDQCRNPLQCYAVVDSEIWEQIAKGDYALCTLCMNERMTDVGIIADCDLQLVRGGNLRHQKTGRAARAAAWRPKEYLQFESVGLPSLYRKSNG